MISWLKKCRRTVQVELSSQLAFKLNIVLGVIGPALVFFLIRINIWKSIYIMRDGAPLAGYSYDQMIQYQVLVFLVVILGQSFLSRNISEDIRMGRISAFLLYPFGFLSFQISSFLAAQCVNVCTGIVIALLVWGGGISEMPTLLQLSRGLAMTALVSCFWFWLWMGFSVAAFWIEETWVLRVCFMLVAKFLSGAVLPLELFPAAFRTALLYTPFPYLTSVPVQLFSGSADVALLPSLGVLGAWTLLAFGVTTMIWKRGLRLYCAAGI